MPSRPMALDRSEKTGHPVSEARYNAVVSYIVSQGDLVRSWPNTASIIATAIEVALNFDNETTTDEVTT